jgi:putative transposase
MTAAQYGYRRVWAVLRLNGQPTNQKRIYRVMRDHQLLLHRRGDKRVSNRRHDGRIAVDVINTRWCSDGFELGCDNGSCYTASKTRSFAGELGLKPVTTWIRSPQSNGMAESFVRTFKRDYADLAHRPDAQTVMRQLAGWFDHHNTRHPHSALGYLPPRLFREKQAVNY